MLFSKKTKDNICIVHLTTFPPRECGLATFSADLINYSDELFSGKIETKVVAINTTSTKEHKYGNKVIFQIKDTNKEDYISVAESLNKMSEVKMVCIEHEFGIFGENFGENLIYFLEKLEKPTAITLHTVLKDPSSGMKDVMEKLLRLGNYFVVMTELSRQILIDVYGAQTEKIKIIPHGIHPKPYVKPQIAKRKLELQNKTVLSTFGLLGRGKGVEYAIEALPEIVKKYPNVTYLVLGATHPVVFEREGESYRNELIELAKKLDVEKNIEFHNKYLSVEELLYFLQATDIYLALSTDPNQTVSGTLSYALGAGRPVISTRFMQAREIITSDVGRLIDFRNSKAIEQEVLNLLGDPEMLLSMGKSAYFTTRSMTWPNVALAYMSMFSSMLPAAISEKNKYMLPIKIDYLRKLTDQFGVLQFASLSDPDPKWGYTLDDNARALVAMCWYKNIDSGADVDDLIKIYLSFIEIASKKDDGFINYFNEKQEPYDHDRSSENLEDAKARALWALAVAMRSNIDTNDKETAKNLFKDHFSLHKKVNSPRAAAFYIKAFAEYANIDEREKALEKVKLYADFLVDLFKDSSDEKWQWFEGSLTYSNAVMSEALLIAYTLLEDQKYIDIAKASLDFLLDQSFEGDVCVPVGQAGWFKKGGKKERYDQQPEEVSALVLALRQMIAVSSDGKYATKLMLAFDWFLGNNLSKQVVYTHSTGGCYDGIGKNSINLNQGSESTIAYLLARLSIESLKE